MLKSKLREIEFKYEKMLEKKASSEITFDEEKWIANMKM